MATVLERSFLLRFISNIKEMTLEVIRNNPYQLIEEVDGIGFGRADDIGRALGISGITTTVYAQDVLHVRECLITTWSRLYEEGTNL